MYKARIRIDATLDCTGFIKQNFTLKEISNIIENELCLEGEFQRLVIGEPMVSVKYYEIEEEEKEN